MAWGDPDLSYLLDEAPIYPCGACGSSMRAIMWQWNLSLDPFWSDGSRWPHYRRSEEVHLTYKCDSCGIELDVRQGMQWRITSGHPLGRFVLTPADETRPETKQDTK